MGLYLEPLAPLADKRAFLFSRARLIPFAQVHAYDSFGVDSQELICLIDNGRFLAAGVLFSASERTRFLAASEDQRNFTWFILPHKELKAAGTSLTLIEAYRDNERGRTL